MSPSPWGFPVDARMHAPRNAAINCSSSHESPRRNRRTRDFRELSAHATNAATKALRTADLLSVRNHTNSVDLAVLLRKPNSGASGYFGCSTWRNRLVPAPGVRRDTILGLLILPHPPLSARLEPAPETHAVPRKCA